MPDDVNNTDVPRCPTCESEPITPIRPVPTPIIPLPEGFVVPPRRGKTLRERMTPEEIRRNAEAWKAALGQWPGDETDEEIEAALRELS